MNGTTKSLNVMTHAELIAADAECRDVIGNASRYFDRTIAEFRVAQGEIRAELKRRDADESAYDMAALEDGANFGF